MADVSTGFLTVLGMGWMFAILLTLPIIVGWREFKKSFRMFGRKSKVILLRMIGSDANEVEEVMAPSDPPWFRWPPSPSASA